MAIVDVIS